MTEHIKIGDIEPRIQYLADGVVAVFPYDFPIFADANLAVYVDADKLTGGYTLSGAGESAGGAAAFDTAPAAGKTVTLARETVIARTSDFQDSGALLALDLNTELDTRVAVEQELGAAVGRSVRLAPNAPAAGVVLPAAEAGRVAKWNDDATALITSDHDPDVASTAAIAATATAEAALDAAQEARAFAVDSGLAVIMALQTSLVAGVQDYLLPEQTTDAVNIDVFIGGQHLDPGPDYTLTDLLGTGRTLHLAEAVSDTPTGTEWATGQALFARVMAKGLTSTALVNGAILERHVETGAASNRWLGAGIVEGSNIAGATIPRAALVPLAGPGTLPVGGTDGVWDELAAGPAGTVLAGQGAGVKPVYAPARRPVPLAVIVPSGTAPTIDLDGAWWSDHDRLIVEINGIRPAASAQGLATRVKIDEAWKAGAADYAWGRTATKYGADFNKTADFSDSEMQIEGIHWSNLTRGRMYGSMEIRKESGNFRIFGNVHFGATNDGGWGTFDTDFDGWLRTLEGQTTQGLQLLLMQSGDFSTDGNVTVLAYLD